MKEGRNVDGSGYLPKSFVNLPHLSANNQFPLTLNIPEAGAMNELKTSSCMHQTKKDTRKLRHAFKRSY